MRLAVFRVPLLTAHTLHPCCVNWFHTADGVIKCICACPTTAAMTVADGSDKLLLRVYVTHLLLLGWRTDEVRGLPGVVCVHSSIQNHLSWFCCSQWAQTPFRLVKRADPLSPHSWARSWDTWTSCTRRSTSKTHQIKHWTILVT